MNEARADWVLDQPGGAGRRTLVRSAVFSAALLVIAAGVVAFGRNQLAPNPQFATFYAGFLLPVNAITAFALLGQFVYRRLPSYLFLAAAFLFSSLIMIPFLLSFPGALVGTGAVIGGEQSAIWIWHLWHLLFPAIIAFALALGENPHGTIPHERVLAQVAATVGAVLLLVGMVTVATTTFHSRLPQLILADRLTADAYNMGMLAALVAGLSLALALRRAWRRSILHIWLAVVLLAWLCDVITGLTAFSRYTVGWYLGRVGSMIAFSALLVVFLNDVNSLYHRLADAMRDLVNANGKLSALVAQKDALLTDLRQSEAKIRRMAYHDTITDLPNRRWLLEELNLILMRAARHGHSTALLFLDLDNFKQVNDSYGHETGDALLKEVAARLVRCVRGGDIVSRLGGDEFVIVAPEIANPSDPIIIANKILNVIADISEIGAAPVHITASLGIAINSGGYLIEAEELLRQADEAMYAAKRAGRNRYRMRLEKNADSS